MNDRTDTNIRRRRQARRARDGSDVYGPFDAVPRIADGVEVREDAHGMIQIRRIVPQTGRLAKWIARRLRTPRYVRINLDAYGTLFWNQIDGRRNLRDIEDILREATRQDRRQSEEATVQFVKMLVQRRLIYLTAPMRAQQQS